MTVHAHTNQDNLNSVDQNMGSSDNVQFNKIGAGVSPNEKLTVEGALSLDEQASAPSATSGYGKVYVKTDGVLYYLDDCGNEQQISEFAKNYVNGLKLNFVNASTFQVEAGECRDFSDTLNIVLSSNINVDITVSGAGGLDSGSEAASTWYAVFVIGDTNGVNSPTTLLSVNTTPSLPSGYDSFRRIGWVRNDSSSNFINMNQYALGGLRRYMYVDTDESNLRVLSAGTATSFTTVDCSSFIPSTSTLADAFIEFDNNNTAGDNLAIRPNGTTCTGDGCRVNVQIGIGLTDFFRVREEIITNSSQEIQYRLSSASDSANISIFGFTDEI